jgi:hypothetical protein
MNIIFQAIYCYTPEGRGPCYAIEGQKIMLEWFRSYLVIIAKDTGIINRSTVFTKSRLIYLSYHSILNIYNFLCI